MIKQKGFSLIELLVSLVIGIFVLGVVGAAYMSSVSGGSNALRQTKVSHELRSAMDIISADIRRAGYSGGSVSAAAPGVISPGPNPFTAPANDLAILNGGTCILFSYDRPSSVFPNGNGAVDPPGDPLNPADIFGYRLNGGRLEMPQPGSEPANTTNCGNGTWDAITDLNTVIVDSLVFSLAGSSCLNGTRACSWPSGNDSVRACATPPPDPPQGADICTTATAPVAGDLMFESRRVTITLTGRHAADNQVTIQLADVVQVPNDRVFTHVVAP